MQLYLPLLLRDVARFLQPADVDAFQRLHFIDMPPQPVKQELGARIAVDDAATLDLKAMLWPKALYLDIDNK